MNKILVVIVLLFLASCKRIDFENSSIYTLKDFKKEKLIKVNGEKIKLPQTVFLYDSLRFFIGEKNDDIDFEENFFESNKIFLCEDFYIKQLILESGNSNLFIIGKNDKISIYKVSFFKGKENEISLNDFLLIISQNCNNLNLEVLRNQLVICLKQNLNQFPYFPR